MALEKADEKQLEFRLITQIISFLNIYLSSKLQRFERFLFFLKCELLETYTHDL